MAGPRLRAAAEAAESRAQPGVTLRPFVPFSGAAEADEGGGDWSFIDCEMEEVDLQDLPSATIACHLDPRVFVDGLCRVSTGPGGPLGGGLTLVAPRRRRGSRRPGPGRPGAASPARAAGWGPRGDPQGCGDAPGCPAAVHSWPGGGGGALPEGPGSQSTCRAARAPRAGALGASPLMVAGHLLPETPLPPGVYSGGESRGGGSGVRNGQGMH